MPVFEAGAIIGRLKLDMGGWAANVRRAMSDALGLKRNLGDVGASATATKTRIADLGITLRDVLATAAGSAGVGLLVKSFVQAAAEAENLRIVFSKTLGSVEEGNKMFGYLADYASKVTLTFQEVMQGSAALSSVLKGGREQVQAWIPLVGDLTAYAKALGISTQESFIQVVRMISGGAATADLFRENGISAMLNFKAGVQYTARETAQQLINEWQKADSKFRGMATDMAKTWDGQMSMMQDRWYLFRLAVTDTGIYRALVAGLTSVNKAMDVMMDKIFAWLELHDAAFTRATIAVAILVAALGTVIAAKVAWMGLVSTFTLLGAAIGLPALPAALLVGALVAGAVAVGAYWGEIKETFYTVAGAVTSFAATVADAWARVIQFTSLLWSLLVSRWDATMNAFKIGLTFVRIAFSSTVDNIKAYFEAFWTFLNLMWGSVTSSVSTVALYIRTAFGVAFKYIADLFSPLLSAARAIGGILGKTVSGFVDEGLAAIKILWNAAGNTPPQNELVANLRAVTDVLKVASAEYTNLAKAQAEANAKEKASVGSVKSGLEIMMDKAKKATDMLFGISDAGDDAGKKAAKAAEKLANQADELLNKLLPVQGALNSLREQYELLSKTGRLSDEAMVGMAKESWGQIKDYSGDAVNAIIDGAGKLNAKLGEFLNTERIKATAADVQKVMSEIAPPDLQMQEEILGLVERLKKGGAWNDDTANMLTAAYWKNLQELSVGSIQAIVDAVNSSAFTDAVERFYTKDQKDKGISIFRDLAGIDARNEALQSIQQVSMAFDGLKAQGAVTADSVSLFSKEFWDRWGFLGVDNIRRILEQVPGMEAQLQAAFDKTLKQAEREKKAQKYEDMAGQWAELGSALDRLGPKFKGVAFAAQSASRIMSIQADIVKGDWMAVAAEGINFVADAMGLMGEETEKVATGMDRVMEEIGNSIEGWVDQFTDAIVEFVKTGKLNFKEFVDSVLEDITRLIIKYAILEPLLGSLGISMTPNAMGNAFDKGNIIPFARGGVVERPTAFPMAGRRVGVMGEAGPEAVMPLKRLANGRLGVSAEGSGAPKVELNIIDMRTGSEPPVEVEQSTRADGTPVIKALIRSQINEAIRDGSIDRTLGMTYGLRRRGA